jgi:23S rRNA pseudouridine1911/1915/1917 synthase
MKKGAAELHHFEVPAHAQGTRADAFVADCLPEMSRQAAKKLFSDGRVRVEGRALKKGDPVEVGMRLEVSLPPSEPWVLPKTDPRIRVFHEDAQVVVVDKPAGMHTHPLERGEGGTALDGVAALFAEVAGDSDGREGLVLHRLDQNTSGLLAFARDPQSHRMLRDAFSEGLVEKGYLALVEGQLFEKRHLTRPIAHHPSDPARMVVASIFSRHRGVPQRAETRVWPLLNGPKAALVGVLALGGRRHQVRVHLAGMGLPLLGDVLYGGPQPHHLPGHALVASWLRLPRREPICCPLPEAFLREGIRRGMKREEMALAHERLGRILDPPHRA